MTDAQPLETTPKHLLVGALGFLDAAEKLNTPDPRGHPLPWPAFFVLVAYAFEMSFKAVVRGAGGSEKDIRALGHDLERGLEAALAAGYAPPEGMPLAEALEALSPLHRDHSLRYFMGAEDRVVTLPEPDDILAVLRDHLMNIRVSVPL